MGSRRHGSAFPKDFQNEGWIWKSAGNLRLNGQMTGVFPKDFQNEGRIWKSIGNLRRNDRKAGVFPKDFQNEGRIWKSIGNPAGKVLFAKKFT